MSPKDKSNWSNITSDHPNTVGDAIKSNSTTIGFVLVCSAAAVGAIATVKAAKRKLQKAKSNRKKLKLRKK